MSKPEKERQELCVTARKSTKELRRKFKVREQEIKTQVRRNVELKIHKEKELAQKRIQGLTLHHIHFSRKEGDKRKN